MLTCLNSLRVLRKRKEHDMPRGLWRKGLTQKRRLEQKLQEKDAVIETKETKTATETQQKEPTNER